MRWERCAQIHVVLSLLQTLNGVQTGVCRGCSTTAYKAQRLWDTSACSATAALITAETLTMCCLSMLGPHFHSYSLQYPKSLTFFCLERGRGRYISVMKEGGGGVGGGGGGGIGWGQHCPQKWDSCFDTHTVDSKQPWTNGNSGFFSHSVFYFYGMKGNTNCNSKKGLQDNYFLGYVFRMPTCLEVSQDKMLF